MPSSSSSYARSRTPRRAASWYHVNVARLAPSCNSKIRLARESRWLLCGKPIPSEYEKPRVGKGVADPTIELSSEGCIGEDNWVRPEQRPNTPWVCTMAGEHKHQVKFRYALPSNQPSFFSNDRDFDGSHYSDKGLITGLHSYSGHGSGSPASCLHFRLRISEYDRPVSFCASDVLVTPTKLHKNDPTSFPNVFRGSDGPWLLAGRRFLDKSCGSLSR
ncbi:hypothetical protein K456DRAFT_40911 [Colletotrichum gloeosporioides 23]|nr:hypothetical protein K456DRAFT_40911 [Colletotrichum gloeosporioides 23]